MPTHTLTFVAAEETTNRGKCSSAIQVQEQPASIDTWQQGSKDDNNNNDNFVRNAAATKGKKLFTFESSAFGVWVSHPQRF